MKISSIVNDIKCYFNEDIIKDYKFHRGCQLDDDTIEDDTLDIILSRKPVIDLMSEDFSQFEMYIYDRYHGVQLNFTIDDAV